MKKFTALIVIAVLIACCAFSLISCANSDKLTIVYLGDSIAEAILGASPIAERDSYGYYAIVGRTNNYKYINRSVSGDKTEALLKALNTPDSNASRRLYWVEQADIIHLSILGNDLLQEDFGTLVVAAFAHNDYAPVTPILDYARECFAKVIERIKELNPDATLLVSTVYNPADPQTKLLTDEYKQQLADLGYDSSYYRPAADLLITRLNSIVRDYLTENPGAYHIIDVYSAFAAEYEASPAKGNALIYSDWVHPSNQGHAYIAGMITEKLAELGLADTSVALANYKTLRSEQFIRLFGNSEGADVPAVTKAIAEAETHNDVSAAYFTGAAGLVPQYK